MSDITLIALKRGLRGRCPNCGVQRIFNGYLTTRPYCPDCGAAFSQLRADDAPPWLTILVIGHLLAPLILYVNLHTEMPIGQQMLIWLPLTVGLTLLGLPVAKGLVVALLWCMGGRPMAPAVADGPKTR